MTSTTNFCVKLTHSVVNTVNKFERTSTQNDNKAANAEGYLSFLHDVSNLESAQPKVAPDL
jgi:hypothetical protein